MFNKKDLIRLGISFVIILTVASLLSFFETEQKPKDKKRKKKRTTTSLKEEDQMSSSSAALMVSAPILSIGKPDSTKLPDRTDSELLNDTNEQEIPTDPEYLPENVNEKYYRMKFNDNTQQMREQDAHPNISHHDQDTLASSLNRDELIAQNRELREVVTTLQVELDKQRTYVNTERQGRILAENQIKAEARLRAEAEDVLRLQSTEFGKQRDNLDVLLQNERRKSQQQQEKLHILEAKITYVRTKGMDGQSVEANDVYS